MVKKKETPPNKKLAGKEGALTIFDEQTSRKPNLYPWTEPFIRAMHDGFWTDREFSFKSDVQQFKVELTEQYSNLVLYWPS